MTRSPSSTEHLAPHAGVGLRAPHLAEVFHTRPQVSWFEVHAENYFGGAAWLTLEHLRQDYPLSIHGVGLSLGSATALDSRHLLRLQRLVERLEPALVSEHLAWCMADGVYLNHLLPLPYTEESLDIVCRHIEQVQTVLGRCLLVENPSSYLRFATSVIPEPEFLSALVQRTGCGLLCDVNNIYVSSQNFDADPVAYLAQLPAPAIAEIHLAGHAVNDADGQPILIDDHGSAVCEAVWHLYTLALERCGPVPTLIEWDTNIPAFPVLVEEARKAEHLLTTVRRAANHV